MAVLFLGMGIPVAITLVLVIIGRAEWADTLVMAAMCFAGGYGFAIEHKRLKKLRATASKPHEETSKIDHPPRVH